MHQLLHSYTFLIFFADKMANCIPAKSEVNILQWLEIRKVFWINSVENKSQSRDLASNHKICQYHYRLDLQHTAV